ncbi:MAG: hypothetical protein IMZ62_16005 [Chloroflexi bacterium]|nr:hypothetical protein [Chloroflexota bacterium]
MAKLLIEVECAGIMCGGCKWLWDFWTLKKELSCLLFIDRRGHQRRLGHYKTLARRHAACLAAEKAGKKKEK